MGLKLKTAKLCTQHCYCWRDRERERERETEAEIERDRERERGRVLQEYLIRRVPGEEWRENKEWKSNDKATE